MIRRLSTGKFRLYSRKKDPRTGKRKNLGTFKMRAAAERHEAQMRDYASAVRQATGKRVASASLYFVTEGKLVTCDL